LPDTNGHNLMFNLATVGAGYTLEAAATANVVAGRVTSYTVFNSGAGYISTPTVTVDPPSGCTLNGTTCVTATATATMAGGVVTKVTRVNQGNGYTSAPNVTFTGGGVTPNANDGGAIALTAKNSIFSDVLNQANANAVAGFPNLAPASAPVQGQYCNGARVPPEQCSTNQGANNPGMCAGYFTPAGQSETFGVAPVFTFNGIKASATVDEGNNWINMTYGPLTLGRPTITGGTTVTEMLVASPATAAPAAAYTPASAVVVAGTPTGAPGTDFFGQTRSNKKPSIGAVELNLTQVAFVSVTGGPVAFGNVLVGTAPSPTQTLTVRNDGGVAATGLTIGTLTAPFSRTTNCGAALASGATCTITVTFTPTAATSYTGSLAITSSVPVSGAPVALSGTGTAAVRTFTVTPTTLAFGNWAAGASNVTSTAQTVTVTNTGNIALAGGSFTFGGGAPQPFSRPGGAAAGTCGATLALGASCTVNVVFAPATATGFSRTLTVGYTTATGTGSPVTFSGTGVAARATVSVTPNPLTITALSGSATGAGTITFTNTAAAGGSQVAVNNVAVAGGSFLTYFFLTTNNCAGVALAPGASCTVPVDFVNVLSPKGVDRAGTISFTDTGAASPQSGGLIGHANP
jgi:hypothetical protein